MSVDQARVEQCDREAAAGMFRQLGRDAFADNVELGEGDFVPMVQAFACHRSTAQAEAFERGKAVAEAGQYLIDLYKRLWLDKGPVRDLAEAEGAWEAAVRAALASKEGR